MIGKTCLTSEAMPSVKAALESVPMAEVPAVASRSAVDSVDAGRIGIDESAMGPATELDPACDLPLLRATAATVAASVVNADVDDDGGEEDDGAEQGSVRSADLGRGAPAARKTVVAAWAR